MKNSIMGAADDDTSVLRDAIVKTAGLLGSDGKGKDGLVGHFTRLARKQPKRFGQLLGRVLPYPVTYFDQNSYEEEVSYPEDLTKLSLEEMSGLQLRMIAASEKTAMADIWVVRTAIIKAAAAVGSDGKGKEGLLGYLKMLAKKETEQFEQLLGRTIRYHISDGDYFATQTNEESDEIQRFKTLRSVMVEKLRLQWSSNSRT